MVFILLYIFGLLLVPTKGEVCHDLDPMGCASLIGANSNLCHEEVFAHAACQRTCGLCPVTCYHCDDPVSNYQECNVTKSCNEGEKCMISEVLSSKDGHHEYRMNCASDTLCDGRDLFSLIGRRDISSHCCTTDLCNRPGTTTEAPTTVPTTTSLMYCSKDIYIAVETFLRHGHETEMDLVRQFLAALSSALPPGHQISIAKFGSHFDIEIKFHDAQDPQRLNHKINGLSLTASTLLGGGQPHVDFQRLGHDLVNEIQHNHNGARTNVPDSVLIITNNRTDVASHSTTSAVMLTSLTSSVTVLNVGSPSPTLASNYATNSNHEIAVPNYQGLMSAIPQVVSLLCS